MRGGRRRSNVVQQLSSLKVMLRPRPPDASVNQMRNRSSTQSNLVATTDPRGPQTDVLDQLHTDALHFQRGRELCDRIDNV